MTVEVCSHTAHGSAKLPRFRSISEDRVADHLMCAQHFRLSGQICLEATKTHREMMKNGWKQLQDGMFEPTISAWRWIDSDS